MSGSEALLILVIALALFGVLLWFSFAGRDRAWRRAVARRERLRAEIELQRLTHLAVLRMLAAAREHHRPGQ
jgi:hypothetical protein